MKVHKAFCKLKMCDFDVANGNELFILSSPRQFSFAVRKPTKQQIQCDNIVSRKWRIPSSTNWFAIIVDFPVSPLFCLSFSILFSLFFFFSLLIFIPFLPRKLYKAKALITHPLKNANRFYNRVFSCARAFAEFFIFTHSLSLSTQLADND